MEESLSPGRSLRVRVCLITQQIWPVQENTQPCGPATPLVVARFSHTTPLPSQASAPGASGWRGQVASGTLICAACAGLLAALRGGQDRPILQVEKQAPERVGGSIQDGARGLSQRDADPDAEDLGYAFSFLWTQFLYL